MGQSSVQAPALLSVPLQAVPADGAIPSSTPLVAIQEGSRVGESNRVVDDGVIQQLRWIEKLVFVCIFLALYAIFKK
jgi:hypothetical protein